MEGEGVMLVIAVGVNSTRGQIAMSLEEDTAETPLQERLDKLANQIGIGGTAVAVCLFLVLVIEYIVHITGDTPDCLSFIFLFYYFL